MIGGFSVGHNRAGTDGRPSDRSRFSVARVTWLSMTIVSNSTCYCTRAYKILDNELRRVEATNRGQNAGSLRSLEDPVIDWVKVASGSGGPRYGQIPGVNLTRRFHARCGNPVRA
jgi:hypothetical protein